MDFGSIMGILVGVVAFIAFGYPALSYFQYYYDRQNIDAIAREAEAKLKRSLSKI